MNPERTTTINGIKIEEFYWHGKLIVYVEDRFVALTYEEAVNNAVGGGEKG